MELSESPRSTGGSTAPARPSRLAGRCPLATLLSHQLEAACPLCTAGHLTRADAARMPEVSYLRPQSCLLRSGPRATEKQQWPSEGPGRPGGSHLAGPHCGEEGAPDYRAGYPWLCSWKTRRLGPEERGSDALSPGPLLTGQIAHRARERQITLARARGRGLAGGTAVPR